MQENTTQYLIIGGGVTAAAAAQSIRESGDTTGRIVILCGESHPPYDRPPLSKQFLLDDSWKTDDPYSKADDFYPKNRVEFRTGNRVASFDPAAKTATLESGDVWRWEKLLLATGSRAVPLDIPGGDGAHVHLLRTIEDSQGIRAAIQSATTGVSIGAGYIGMEVTSAATQRGVAMTVVDPGEQPWSKFASKRVGGFLQRYFEGKGVRFVFGEQAATVDASGVTTDKGTILPADFVVAGVGVRLNTDLARAAGLDVDEKQGVVVDAFLRTSAPAVYAAGDIAFFDDIAVGKRWHAEHHLNAKWQGQAVGKILAGADQPYDRVSYFYSDIFDLHMCLRGDPEPKGDEHTLLVGDLDGAEFTELRHDDAGLLRGGLIFSRDEAKMDAISDKIEALIRAKTDILAPGFDPEAALR